MNYWDKVWSERIRENGVNMNKGKVLKLCKALWNRPYFFPMRKFEIGCGPGVHVKQLSEWAPMWGETWIGIDPSAVAVRKACEGGFDATVADIYTLDPKRFDKSDLFLFLDVLEHLEHHDKVAAKVEALSRGNLTVFGNTPLYLSECEGNERPMDINVINKFLLMCGCTHRWHEIYGINGYPYMMFEGHKEAT